MRKIAITALSSLLLAFSAGVQAVPMQALLDGGTMQVGDKLFSDWEVFSLDVTDANQTVDYSQIDVSGDNLDPMNPGLIFDAGDQLTVSGTDLFGFGNFIDLYFGFSVTVLDPAKRIKDNSLTLGEYAIEGSPYEFGGLLTIQEDVYDDAGNLVCPNLGMDVGDPCKEVFVDNWFGDEQTFDEIFFAPQQKIFVEKNIYVASGDNGEMISIGGFEQHFSQTTVPEPATLLLFGGGMAGLLFCRRRKTGGDASIAA